MRFKRRSDKEQRPTAFYQPPADGEAAADAQAGDGAPSATPASAKRNGAEKPRRNGKLLRPLWWSLPIVVVALAVGIYMTALPLWAWNTGRSARAGNNEGALNSYSRQIYWGDLGPASWVAHYNAGTQHVKLDHPDEAVAELRIAWDRVPKAKQIEDGRIETYSYECTVRMNLALALEKQGDAAMSTDRARAAEIYKEMGEVVAPCQSAASTQNQQNQNQQGGGGGADADKAHDRAQQKQQQAQNQENQDKDKDKDKQNQDKDKQNQDKDKQNQDNKDKDKQNQDQQNQNQDKDKQNQDKSKDPYQGETKEQRAKREEMQKRQEQTDREERQNKDRKRGTGGTGAW
ncbi:hypothetical protein [Actinomyces sp. oral taxon 181]|uniref:hypothetical protein n=1 Tax=Actinomyces sp. oral taxon 181 TaxID=712121 RepID=UPI0002A41ACE|nr:hypothetical protein [Actinomyces sp. oral taxon 181]EKY15265.1 hypothetical protein HMPREF9061_00804 [Actinomyces sp. oral taxon 181 str. F0379]